MRYILCLAGFCALCRCGRTVNISSCKLDEVIEENNEPTTANIQTAIGDSLVTQSLQLTNALTLKRVKFRMNLTTGAAFTVWVSQFVPPTDVFDTSGNILVKFDSVAPAGVGGLNSPADLWLDLPAPIDYDPRNGDLFLTIASRSIAILGVDLGNLGPSHFRNWFESQDSIHAWLPRKTTSGMSVGISGTTDNCDGAQTGQ